MKKENSSPPYVPEPPATPPPSPEIVSLQDFRNLFPEEKSSSDEEVKRSVSDLFSFGSLGQYRFLQPHVNEWNKTPEEPESTEESDYSDADIESESSDSEATKSIQRFCSEISRTSKSLV